MATFVNKQGQRIGGTGVFGIGKGAGVQTTRGPNPTYNPDIPEDKQAVPVGDYAYTLAYLGDQYPSPFLVNTAPYKFTDPFKFAEQYGAFQRQNLYKNFDVSKDLALRELDTELAGLKQFVPAASALKREQVALDNPFNQAQRLAQVDFALPGVSNQLNAQSKRAEAFASGRAPDEVTDRALELGVRSRAADSAYSGGFGTGSAVARKTSDLLSAEQRIGLSQYGDQLLNSNIAAKSNLLLAPTEYSDAGSQVRVVPEVGGARLAAGAFTEINNQANIPAQTALSADINQNQFKTNLEQQTRVLNAGVQNQFALDKFQYDVGYAGAVAGAAQTNVNTEVAIEQQKRAEEIFLDAQKDKQKADRLGALVETGTAALATVGQFIGLGLDTSDLPPGNDLGQTQAPSPLVSTPPSGKALDVSTPSSIPQSAASNPAASAPTTSVSYGSPQVGKTLVAPAESIVSQPIQSFAQDTGLATSIANDPNQPVTKALLQSGNATLNSVGLSSIPQPGTVPLGYSSAGTPLFVSPKLQQSSDTGLGQKVVEGVGSVLDPMGALSATEQEALSQLGEKAGSVELINELTDKALDKDPEAFINTLLEATGQKSIDSIKKTDDPEALKQAFSAYELYNNWNQLSPAQKSLGIASSAMQGFRSEDGKPIGDKSLVSASEGVPSLKVKEALNLVNKGYNVYPLIQNWGQLSGIQKIAGGESTPESVAQIAKQFNLAGKGKDGANVLVDPGELSRLGYFPTPSLGIGAISAKANTKVPEGYVRVLNKGNTTIAIPAANKNSFALADGSGKLYADNSGEHPVALTGGSLALYKNWKGEKPSTVKGALGGSAMVSGLDDMANTNPYVLGAVVSASLAGGESSDKLDYVSKLSSNTLGYLLAGNKEGKGPSIPVNTELTKDNYFKYQQVARGTFSKEGIKSKSEAMQLINQGYSEGRWNESETASMQQVVNMVFDPNGFDTAQKLITGSERGKHALPAFSNKTSSNVEPLKKTKLTSKEEVKARNILKFSARV